MQMFQFTSISMLWVLGVSLMGGLHVQFTISNSFSVCFLCFSTSLCFPLPQSLVLFPLHIPLCSSLHLSRTFFLSLLLPLICYQFLAQSAPSSFSNILPLSYSLLLSIHLLTVVLCHFWSDIYYLLAAKLKHTQPNSSVRCTMAVLAVIPISSGQLLV